VCFSAEEHSRLRTPREQYISPQYVEVAVHGQIGQEVHTRFNNRLARALGGEALLNRIEDCLVTQSKLAMSGPLRYLILTGASQAGGGGDRRPCFSR
jgi:hypothetical protein